MKKPSVALLLLAPAILVLAAAISMTIGATAVQAGGEPIVVIVNSSNPVDNLSIGELKKLFLSDKSRWETGKAVAPVMVGPGQPERVAFLKIVCGMGDADFSKYFMQAAFTGKDATPPKEVSNAQALKAVVAVPHAEVQRRIEEHRKEAAKNPNRRGPKPK